MLHHDSATVPAMRAVLQDCDCYFASLASGLSAADCQRTVEVPEGNKLGFVMLQKAMSN
jgi:hypothetical protein